MPGDAWHVLLVGGPSGVGKSRAVAELVRGTEVAVTGIDDLHAAVLAMTTPAQQPVLHEWSEHGQERAWTADELVDLTVAVARALAPALRAVVAAHLDHGPRVVIEGDYLHPGVAAELCGARVRAVVLVDEEAQLAANLLAREPDDGPQDMRARVSALFGRWLAAEAARHHVPALPARPWDTLPARIRSAASG